MNRDEAYSVEGLTFDTRAEDLKHVWIPQSLKMCINKTHGLEVCSWTVTEEVGVWSYRILSKDHSTCERMQLVLQ